MVEDFTEGEGMEMTIGMERNVYTIRGRVHAATIAATYTAMEKIKKFCRYHNRDDSKQAYLLNRISASDYELFYKGDKTEVQYLKGYVMKRDIIYNEGSLYFNVVILFRVVWGTQS